MSIAPNHAATLTERYLALVDRYAGFVTGAGKTLHRATPERARKLFESTTEARRKSLVARLEVENSIFEETLAAGDKLTDSRKLLWRHFSRSGFVPCSDLFDKIGDTDVVEVYGMDQIHLTQNLNFFDWIGFTLEQLFCQEWFTLTRRDKEVEKYLYEVMVRIFSGEITTTVAPEAPWHLIEETDSELMNKFFLRVKYASPVFSGGKLCALVAINECKPYQE